MKSMHGTRDAAQNWEPCYISALEDMGFGKGKASVCVFYNEARDARVVVHGDDFTILASEDNVQWFVREVGKKFEMKLQGIIGPSKYDQKRVRVLNRIVTWDESGIKFEALQRHAEMIIKTLDLNSSNLVCTPGERRRPRGGRH